MSSVLKTYFTLAIALFAIVNLWATDFTISGKVSLIQEAVPLPFYDVNIADSEGKYVATAKTSFNGTYKITFDIPDNENPVFEISVIDRCTDKPIITSFQKEGDSFKINFIICHQEEELTDCNADFDYQVIGTEVHFTSFPEGNITEWAWDFGDGNISNEPSPIHNYEKEGLYLVSLKIIGENCEDGKEKVVIVNPNNGECICTQEYNPVCVQTDFGITIPFPNACLAECAGFSDFVDCEDNPIDSTCACPEYYHPVCVILDDSTQLEFPNECFAVCEGYFDFFSCEEEPVDSNCFCPEYYHPVCVILDDSTQLEFPNECFAVCEGYFDFFNCGEVPPFNEDCDLFGFEFPVCVILGDGEVLNFPNPCEALAEGYQPNQLGFCDGSGIGEDSIDCSALGIDFPVCVFLEDGDKMEFPNPCEAINAGFDISQLTFCVGGIGGGKGFDCSDLGMDLPITVCVTQDSGETIELLLCDAIKEGFSFDQIEFCNGEIGGLDSIDCSDLGIDIPICVMVDGGDTLTFPNPCEAFKLGYTFDQLSFCGTPIDIGEELDCEKLGFDFPFPVCVSLNGALIEFPGLCEALAEGFNFDQIEFCDGLGGLDSFDCATLDIDLPVCIIDSNGNKTTFESPCKALTEGFDLNQLSLCDNIFGEGELCQAIFYYYPEGLNNTLQFMDESLGEVNSWSWDFGDGNTSTKQNPSHTYETSGEYEVTLTITADSCESSITLPAYTPLDNGLLDSCLTIFAYYPKDSTTIQFQDGSITLSEITSWFWEFGDGNTSTDQNPIHQYDAIGEYTASLTITTADSCTGTLELPVIVGVFSGNPDIESAICQAFFFFDQDEKDAMTITFHDLSFGNVSEWFWDFGDGATANEPEVVHTYTESGLYEVTLVVKGENCESKFTMIVFTDLDAWYNADCQALFVPTVNDKTVKFWEISQGNVTSWEWDFGDGSTSTESGPTHTYEVIGEYVVSLTINTVDSCTSTFELQIDLGDGLTGGIVADLAKAFGLTDAKEETILIEKAELFPNPVLNELKIALKFTEGTEYEVRIHSINGNAIYRQKFNAFNTESVANMDVSSLLPGIYVAQVVTRRGIKALKFVKW